MIPTKNTGIHCLYNNKVIQTDATNIELRVTTFADNVGVIHLILQ